MSHGLRACWSHPILSSSGAVLGSVAMCYDNEDTVRSTARLLRLKGHDVATASIGFEAVERVNEFRPEIVLLAIGLPGMDGDQVAQKLRAEHRNEGLLIIAISGYGQDEDRRRSTSSGIDPHLVKPIDHDALLTLIGRPC